jgi:tyrosine-protein kinase Etk/Wzc
MPEHFNNQSDRQEINPLDYLVVLAKHSRLIVYSGIAVFILTYLILFILPNKYTAKTRLLPPQRNLTLSGELLNTLGGGTPGAPTGMDLSRMAASALGINPSAQIYVSMMTGDTVFDRIIARFNLRKLYKDKYIETTRRDLGKHVSISVGKDGIISIEVTDKDPKRAAAMANAFAGELDKLLQGLARQEAKGRLAFLEKERNLANQNLAKAENALRNFSEQNSVIQIDTQTRGVLEYIARLRALIDVKEVQIQVMRQQATPYNYDVVKLETEIQGLKNKLKTAENHYDQGYNGDVCLPTNKMPTLGLEYLRFYREVKFQNALHQLYSKMVELARLDMVRNFSMVQVVDRALPPEKRSNKRLLWALLPGMVTGLVMIFFSFGYEYWQKARFDEDDSRRIRALKDNLRQWTHPFRR